jgi:uncharacterized protein YceK
MKKIILGLILVMCLSSCVNVCVHRDPSEKVEITVTSVFAWRSIVGNATNQHNSVTAGGTVSPTVGLK